MNQLKSFYKVEIPKKGDFIVDANYLFKNWWKE